MKSVPWTKQFRRALAAPGNLIAGSGALALAAITWNPLPVILFGLGEPVWLYNATASDRYADAVRAEHDQRTIAVLERELAAFVEQTPCGSWMRGKQLPSYPVTYRRLVEMRDQTAQIVAARDDAAKQLEEDIVARMNDMLRAYLLMVRERLLFHCARRCIRSSSGRAARRCSAGSSARSSLHRIAAPRSGSRTRASCRSTSRCTRFAQRRPTF